MFLSLRALAAPSVLALALLTPRLGLAQALSPDAAAVPSVPDDGRLSLSHGVENVPPAGDASVIDVTPLAYRLQLWGDVFTPAERDAVIDASDFIDIGRSLGHVEAMGPGARRDEAGRGSAYASAASWSLLFGGEESQFAGNSPVHWIQPGRSERRMLYSRGVLFAANWLQASRGPGASGEVDLSSSFLAKVVALAPLPHRGLGRQAESTAIRIAALSAIWGNWPDPRRMTAAKLAGFCENWTKATLMAGLATGLSSLIVPRGTQPVLASTHVHVRRSHGSVPVTLFDEAF